MGYIHYDLSLSANCAGMAPVPTAGGNFGPATLPIGMAMTGTYIIVNTLTNNRYIGIANDIRNRFNTRLATVTEMGFPSIPIMAAIGVTWGHTRVIDAPPGPVWPGPAAPWMIAAPNPPNAFVTVLH